MLFHVLQEQAERSADGALLGSISQRGTSTGAAAAQSSQAAAGSLAESLQHLNLGQLQSANYDSHSTWPAAANPPPRAYPLRQPPSQHLLQQYAQQQQYSQPAPAQHPQQQEPQQQQSYLTHQYSQQFGQQELFSGSGQGTPKHAWDAGERSAQYATAPEYTRADAAPPAAAVYGTAPAAAYATAPPAVMSHAAGRRATYNSPYNTVSYTQLASGYPGLQETQPTAAQQALQSATAPAALSTRQQQAQSQRATTFQQAAPSDSSYQVPPAQKPLTQQQQQQAQWQLTYDGFRYQPASSYNPSEQQFPDRVEPQQQAQLQAATAPTTSQCIVKLQGLRDELKQQIQQQQQQQVQPLQQQVQQQLQVQPQQEEVARVRPTEGTAPALLPPAPTAPAAGFSTYLNIPSARGYAADPAPAATQAAHTSGRPAAAVAVLAPPGVAQPSSGAAAATATAPRSTHHGQDLHRRSGSSAMQTHGQERDQQRGQQRDQFITVVEHTTSPTQHSLQQNGHGACPPAAIAADQPGTSYQSVPQGLMAADQPVGAYAPQPPAHAFYDVPSTSYRPSSSSSSSRPSTSYYPAPDAEQISHYATVGADQGNQKPVAGADQGQVQLPGDTMILIQGTSGLKTVNLSNRDALQEDDLMDVDASGHGRLMDVELIGMKLPLMLLADR